MSINDIIVFESEVESAKVRLKEQIDIVRRTMDVLEEKLNTGANLYESDGLQGNAVPIDVQLAKIVAYERVLDRLTRA